MPPQTTKLQENYSGEIEHVGKVAMKFEGTKAYFVRAFLAS